MYTCDIQIQGDFQGLADRFSAHAVSQALNQLERVFLKRMANEYLVQLRAAIETGQAHGPALSTAWASVKGHSKPWYHNGDLAAALEVTQTPDKQWHAGISMTAKNRDGQPLHLIAAVLELGSIKVPARPVFDPVAEDFSARANEIFDVKAEVAKAFDI